MRGLFRGLPIKQKLVLMMMATSIAVLLLASVGYIAMDYYNTREDLRRELTTQADVILKNSTAALEFLDPSLSARDAGHGGPQPAHSHRMSVRRDRQTVLGIHRPLASMPCPTAPGPDGYTFLPDRLVIVSSIDLQGRRTGALLLRSDLDLLQTRLRGQLLIVAVLLVLTSGVALLMSSRLHSIVSSPITRTRPDRNRRVIRRRLLSARGSDDRR